MDDDDSIKTWKYLAGLVPELQTELAKERARADDLERRLLQKEEVRQKLMEAGLTEKARADVAELKVIALEGSVVIWSQAHSDMKEQLDSAKRERDNLQKLNFQLINGHAEENEKWYKMSSAFEEDAARLAEALDYAIKNCDCGDGTDPHDSQNKCRNCDVLREALAAHDALVKEGQSGN